MSAARLNSRALTVRGTLPQIGSFSLGAPQRGNHDRGARLDGDGFALLAMTAKTERQVTSHAHPIALDKWSARR
jgi:hypothetical protein